LDRIGILSFDRSKSGYRRFTQTNIEQLRWILTQQQKKFLPLKVIAEQLASGEWRANGSSNTTEAPTTDIASRQGSSAGEGGRQAGSGKGDSADKGSSAEGRQDNAGGRHPGRKSQAAEAGGAAAGGSVVEGSSGGVSSGGKDSSVGGVGSGGSGSGAEDSSSSAGSKASMSPAARLVQSLGDDSQAHSNSAEQAAEATEPLSLEEFLRQSGLSNSELRQLEGFKLFNRKSRQQGYDQLDLEVAQLSQKMLPLGLEPRHLRIYALAAEREADLAQQLARPILARRDPKKRQEGLARLAMVVELGSELQEVLLRRLLENND